MGKKEPKFGINCCGCVHANTGGCDKCVISGINGIPTCYLHCSEACAKSIKMLTDWCATCTNRKTCAIDEGFREDCSYNGTSIPTLWEMDKTVKHEKKPTSREEVFREITEKMADVYAAKNHDYGNSFLYTRERYPNAILIRLFDKLNRLDTLIDGESAKVDESIDDTLVDLANYAVMELVERRMEGEEK